MAVDGEPRAGSPTIDVGRRPGKVPPYALTAAVLLGFAAVSQLIPDAFDRFPSDLPPLFVQWVPRTSFELLVPIGLIGLACVLGPRMLRVRRWVALTGSVAFGWVFAVALAVQSGRPRRMHGCCGPGGAAAILTAPFRRGTDYYANVPLLERVGIRTFDLMYPKWERPAAHVLSLHATTHPPGAPLILLGLSRLVGGSLLGVSLLVVLIGALGAIPTYFVAREFYGERVGRVAAVLFVCSPGVILYSATSMDAVFMTVTAVALAALVRAPRSPGWAVAAGALGGVALCFTWGALALVPIGVGVWLVAARRARPADLVGRGLLALVGLVAATVALRLAMGIDLVACFRAAHHAQTSYESFKRPYGYWVWGNVAGFLITVGVGHTALALAETRDRWHARRPGLETVLWVTLALTTGLGMFRGEVDHNWLFFVPLLIPVAAAATERLRGPTTAGLAQAVVTEVLFYTNW